METVAARIRQARLAQGLSQQDLALVCGVLSTQVSRWERDISKPCLESLTEVSAALGVSSDWLLTGKPTSKKPVAADSAA